MVVLSSTVRVFLDRDPEGQDWLKDWRTLARELNIPEDEFSVRRVAIAMNTTRERVRSLGGMQSWLAEHPEEWRNY